MLAGGEASCDRCNWKGTREDAACSEVEHSFTTDEDLINTFVREVRGVFARTAAKDVGLLLHKWGFIGIGSKELQVEILKRYLEAMARGVVEAVIEERKNIEKETLHVS